MRLISRSVGTTANDFLSVCRGAVFILQHTTNEVACFFLPLFLEVGGIFVVVCVG